MTLATVSAPNSGGNLVARVARAYLAPRWKGLAASILCATAFATLSGLLLGILQPAVNDIVVHPKVGAMNRIPLIIVALAIGRGLAQVLQATMVNRIGNGIVGDVQVDLFAKLVRADLAHLRASHSGSFISSVLYDAGLIREAATTGLVNLIQQGLTLAAAGVVMALTDWKLGMFVVVVAPLAMLVLRRYARRGANAARGAMQATSSLSTALMEGLDGIRVVKMENREAYEIARVAAVVDERQGHILRGDNARAVAAPASETLMMCVVAAILAYEGWRAGATHPDVGAFTAFFAALLMAAQALRQVANLLTVLTQGMTAARRLFAALDIEPEIADRPEAAQLPRGSGVVALEAVSFSYLGGSPVLDRISLVARRGETVALVGPSGAGKSTVLGLIPRFYDVTEGRLTIDGRDIRDVTLASLRSQIALVTQEPFLFDDTIAANIAYARAGATMAEIEAAAKAAAADGFITALPAGYGAVVGEGGARFSGGQRQRIAIARAFLKDAPILLLDEATSALDAESEARVQEALARLMTGRTTLIVAHRLSTVKAADRIYVLDGGRMVETGSHQDLMARGGLYARLAGSRDLAHVSGAAA